MPRWPAGLAGSGDKAVNLAIAPDGRIAIATGGEHAVALFDASGAFLARTATGCSPATAPPCRCTAGRPTAACSPTSATTRSRGACFEPVLNVFAMRLLATRGAHLPAAAGEHVVETFQFSRQDAAGPGRRPGVLSRSARADMRWAVCTNQGLRLFGQAGKALWLDVEFALADIVAVSAEAPSWRMTGVSPAWFEQRASRAGWLAVTLKDGRVVEGTVIPPALHARLVPFLVARHAASAPRPATPPAAPVATTAGPGRAATASGLLFFLPWALIVLKLTVPVAWTVLGSRADVSPHHVALVLALPVLHAALAAWDAWQMGRARPGPTG